MVLSVRYVQSSKKSQFKAATRLWLVINRSINNLSQYMKFEIQVHIYKVSKAPKITDIMMDKLMYRLSIMKKMARINCCALTHYVGFKYP